MVQHHNNGEIVCQIRKRQGAIRVELLQQFENNNQEKALVE